MTRLLQTSFVANFELQMLTILGSGCGPQLTEQSLPKSEDKGLNPVKGKFYLTLLYQNEEKEARNDPFLMLIIFNEAKLVSWFATKQCDQIKIAKCL